ncbi:hypothetical protein BH11VER1_BH11VER1_40470 [soil metagenome]
MKRLLFLACWSFAISSQAGDGALLNTLPQNSIQSAFQILRRDYIRREDLSFEELNRAALQGLLERLDFGASLEATDAKRAAVKPYIQSEFLAPDVAYLRPETYAEGEGALFEKALRGMVEKKAQHLVLDLRAPSSGGLFEEAALMLQCFLPAGELMFKLKQMGRDDAEMFVSKQEPLWKGRVVILIDREICSAAETLAACLKQRGDAFLIGEKTKGATVRYDSLKLDDKALLRYASAEMLLPDGTSLFKKGLEPDFLIQGSMKDKQRVFQESRSQTMKPFVVDHVRHRFNEAALVSGNNPELDDYVKRSKGEPLPGNGGQLRDVVVQRALDTLQAGTQRGESRIKWEAKP